MSDIAKMTTKLHKNITSDHFPRNGRVWSMFGFERCREEQSLSYLFGLYKQLFRYRSFFLGDMIRSYEIGRLNDYIIDQYCQNDPKNFYFQWFLKQVGRTENKICLSAMMIARK